MADSTWLIWKTGTTGKWAATADVETPAVVGAAPAD